mmetsp:Transcript_27223/g.59964  ORF Transcript_27223/g.59964 Transcript_27223/m.59964 type:complete len:199 (+) Transcript_27223:109-705(+)
MTNQRASTTTTTLFLLLSAVLLAGRSEAFTAHSSTTQRTQTSLNLLPDQGNQLVAAYNALSETQRKESKAAKSKTAAAAASIGIVKVNWKASTIAVSKNILSRISVQRGSNGNNISDDNENPNADVCYYPMVGFQYIAGVDTALPTKSTAACAMPTKSQREEEVFGWFSSSCKLDVFSEDVCHNPIIDAKLDSAKAFN